jgi:hypothetical protein
MTFSDYTKELVCIGQEKKIYDLPEAICRVWKLSRQDFLRISSHLTPWLR